MIVAWLRVALQPLLGPLPSAPPPLKQRLDLMESLSTLMSSQQRPFHMHALLVLNTLTERL